ncbi:hypothetical protein EV385_1941 [Krasilnikovia cinnamomea]|uniref:Uncharacterized protein n=1 Tax=Krasilnikovia cinnamomea TaxID=349313 RepID=A0A4V2G6V6_9ACTN|nr:hypothetical protein [Krasilnikovia cinnamomea]RZU50176.1 hypothetical protein EV385_1941 [Krasilnikovia cinnamomea]
MTVQEAVVAEPVPPPGQPPRRALETALRTAGLVISVLAALFSGLLELFLTPLRLGGVWVGAAAIPVAVAANLALAWFAVTTVGRRWALGPPWVAWTVLMLLATGFRRTEGDHLVDARNWVALATVLAGSLAFAVYAYRMILRWPPAPPR